MSRGCRGRGFLGRAGLRGPGECLLLPLWAPLLEPRKAESGEAAHPPLSAQLPTFIAKALCAISFIWATSEHYNTPSRIIVFLQEFCNQIIEMVTWPGRAAPPP